MSASTSWALKVLVFVAVAAGAHVATVALLPRIISEVVMHKAAAEGGLNHALHPKRPDASARRIVRPSPDLLYSACAFDLSAGPLHVTAPVPESYASISGFDDNTNNFFAINDSQVAAGPDGVKRLDVVIARETFPMDRPGAKLVIAPTMRGLVLFRTLIQKEEDLPRLLELQAAQRCEPLGP